MPYIDLRVHPVPSPEQTGILARGITEAMVQEMGKREEVTAVHIGGGEASVWTIGGEPCTKSTAYADIKITAGTNSREQKAALLRRLHRLLASTLGELAEASYIVVHELPAESWGYAGMSQADRHGGRA